MKKIAQAVLIFFPYAPVGAALASSFVGKPTETIEISMGEPIIKTMVEFKLEEGSVIQANLCVM